MSARKGHMKSFLLMLAFFTRIPVRVSGEIDAAQYQKGIKYLPVIGILIGVPMGCVVLLAPWIGSLTAAFLAVAVYLLLSGALHVDGLADTADGFAAHRDREGTLAIMKDSRIGTFGVLAVCVYVLGMTVFIAQAGVMAAALCPLAGRSAALLCARMNSSATDGLGRWFVDGVKSFHVIGTVIIFTAASALGLLVYQWVFPVLLIASFLVAMSAAAMATRCMAKKLGGITGDVIGFSVEFSQLVFLLFSSIAVIIL